MKSLASDTSPINAASSRDATADRTSDPERSALFPALFVFLVVLAVCLVSLARNKQLGFMGGMAEEYLNLGWNLARTGQFYPGFDEFVFRPPGYPFFIAIVLKIWGRAPSIEQDPAGIGMLVAMGEAAMPVYLAQSVLHALTAVMLFFWMKRRLRTNRAVCLALIYGCIPYTVMLTGLLHYSTLHLAFIAAGCLFLQRTMEKDKPRFDAVAAGIVWGLAALIRPTSMILPVFVFAAATIRHRFRWRPIIRVTFLFSIAMTLTIAPYTIRNYFLTGRFIPVNAQGAAVYLNFVKKLERAPNHYQWESIFREILPIYLSVTNRKAYDFDDYVRHNIEMNDLFKTIVREYAWGRRDIYIHNMSQHIVTYLLDINSVMIKVFQFIQTPGRDIDKDWFGIGHPQDFQDDRASRIFECLVYFLTAAGYLAAGWALMRGDRFILVPFFVYLCFCAAHAITLMDIMYYYAKVPFLIVFSACAWNKAQGAGGQTMFKRFRIGIPDGVLLLLTAATAWLSWMVLFDGS